MKKLVSLLFAALSATATIHAQDTPAWQKFVNKADDNVLLDFSYAGYNHGLSLPADGDVETLAKQLGYIMCATMELCLMMESRIVTLC